MLFFVMDPIGNTIIFAAILDGVDKKRKSRIIMRELIISLFILLFFLYFGKYLLDMLQVKEPALSIAGGIVLFIISMKLIFPPKEGLWTGDNDGEPFIVPLATPMIAGPSAIAIVLLLASSAPSDMVRWSIAVFISWLLTCIILLFSNVITRRLGSRLISGIQKLMGMILTVISVQMLLSALERYFMVSG